MRMDLPFALLVCIVGCIDKGSDPVNPPEGGHYVATAPDQDTGSTGIGDIEPPLLTDADGDGHTSDVDCDDADETVNPDASEVCDGVDNNCDGEIDEDVAGLYYVDSDGDGYGDEGTVRAACEPVEGRITVGGDCNDNDADISPVADELCNEVDDNCDGIVDGPDPLDPYVFYQDADGDGFGTPEVTIEACSVPAGYVSNDRDCFDFDEEISPFAFEFCDGRDTDCNGVADDSYSLDADIWYVDEDGDEFGDPAMYVTSCEPVSGHVMNDGDCDDTDALTHAEAEEVCNHRDDDCDGVVDNGFELSLSYRDSDGDGHGDVSMPVLSCTPVAGYVAAGDDCDDGEYWAHPGLVELCDSIDNDCDGIIDEELVFTDFVPDADGDGYGDATGAVITDCLPPAGHVVNTTDCDDGNASIYPAAIESCNGLDDNCNGELDEGLADYTYFLDEDEDGFGIPDITISACAQPPGYSEVDSDCDDIEEDTHPGAYESCDDRDNDCNGLIDDECGSRRDYVMFVTSTFIGSTESTWLDTREDANAYCAGYAADHGIDATDFQVVYSTPEEAARDHLDYLPGVDRVFDRDGTEVGGEDIFDGTSLLLPDMMSWTITGSGVDGTFAECSGSLESGAWPICQFCERKFTCSSSSEGPFTGGSCCWTGTRAILCMGAL